MGTARWVAVWCVVGALVFGLAETAGAQVTVTIPTLSANAGSNFAYSGGGFTPGETISMQLTAPDMTVTDLEAQNADGNGKFVENIVFPGAGAYQVTATGLQSGRQVIAGFNVRLNGAPAPNTSAPTANMSTPAANTGATPIGVYESFAFGGRGFTPNEPVAITVTQPSGNVISLDDAAADDTGLVTTKIGFDMPGQYTVAARGRQSGVVVTQVYAAS